MKGYYLCPYDLEGWRHQFRSDPFVNKPVLYTADHSICIGPFGSSGALQDWADEHPLYHGVIIGDGWHVREPCSRLYSPVTVHDFWEKYDTVEQWFKSFDGPVRELLQLLVQ